MGRRERIPSLLCRHIERFAPVLHGQAAVCGHDGPSRKIPQKVRRRLPVDAEEDNQEKDQEITWQKRQLVSAPGGFFFTGRLFCLFWSSVGVSCPPTQSSVRVSSSKSNSWSRAWIVIVRLLPVAFGGIVGFVEAGFPSASSRPSIVSLIFYDCNESRAKLP